LFDNIKKVPPPNEAIFPSGFTMAGSGIYEDVINSGLFPKDVSSRMERASDRFEKYPAGYKPLSKKMVDRSRFEKYPAGYKAMGSASEMARRRQAAMDGRKLIKGSGTRFKGAGLSAAKAVRHQLIARHGRVGRGLWQNIKNFFRNGRGKQIAEQAVGLAKKHGIPLAETLAKQGVDKISNWANSGTNKKHAFVKKITDGVIVPGMNAGMSKLKEFGNQKGPVFNFGKNGKY
jgi:hypothetical protein